MKYLTLILYQYSKIFFKELLLFVQIALLIIVGYLASSSFLSTYQLSRSADFIYGDHMVYFDLYARIIKIINGSLEFNESEREKLDRDIKEVIMQLEGTQVKGIGEIGRIPYKDMKGNIKGAVIYNTDLIQNTNIPLIAGEWSNLAIKNKNIPMIVSEENCYDLKYGDVFSGKDFFLNSGKEESDTFEVVGVIANHAELPRMLEGGTEARAISFVLEKNMTDDIFLFNLEHLSNYGFLMYSSKLIFIEDGMADEFVKEHKNEILPYGVFATVTEMKQQEWIRSALTHREDIIILFSILFMLFFSIIGYVVLTLKSKEMQNGILMLCGMSKSKLKEIRFFSNFIIYFGAYLTAIPFCIRIYPDFETLWNYLAIMGGVIALLLVFACAISNRLISKMELSIILKGEKNE